MISGMGRTEFSGKKLTAKDAKAPKPICKAPINAEALPAFLEKGAKESAAAFGLINPRQLKNKAIKAMVLYRLSRLFSAASKNNKLTTPCAINAQLTILLLVCHLKISRLTWLEPINAADNSANIHP